MANPIVVRQSSRTSDPKPWQVREILPDQTFRVIERYASVAAAYAAADRLGAPQPRLGPGGAFYGTNHTYKTGRSS